MNVSLEFFERDQWFRGYQSLFRVEKVHFRGPHPMLFLLGFFLFVHGQEFDRILLPGGGKLLSKFQPYGTCSFFASTRAIGALVHSRVSFFQDISEVVQNPTSKPGCVGLLTLDSVTFYLVVGTTDGGISFSKATQDGNCNSKFVLQPNLFVQKASEKVKGG